MHDEETPSPRERPASPAKLSKTPSWIMLGFVLGALFVVALPPLRKRPPAEPARRAEFTKPAAPRQPQPLTTIEAVFAEWGRFAVWHENTAEVALWNGTHRDFTDFFEVRRVDGMYYFRSLPTLTRRIIAGLALPTECPLRFTETEEQFRARLELSAGERVPLDFRPPPPVPGRTRPGVSAPVPKPADPGINLTPDVKK